MATETVMHTLDILPDMITNPRAGTFKTGSMDHSVHGLGTAACNEIGQGVAAESEQHTLDILPDTNTTTPGDGGSEEGNVHQGVHGLGTAIYVEMRQSVATESVMKSGGGSIVPIIQKLGLGIGDLTLGVASVLQSGGGSIVPIIQKLGLGISDLTLGVARNKNLNLNAKNVNAIVRTVESMQNKNENAPPLPKNPQI